MEIVLPNDQAIERKLLEIIYSVPYAGHLGYQKVLKQIQKQFYWKDLILDLRDFVLGHEIC